MDRVEIGSWCSVGVEVIIAPGEILPVVDGEVHVMQGMVCGAVDKLLGPVSGDHVAIVYENGPNLHSNEEEHIQVPIHWADEDKSTNFVGLDTRLR